MKSKNMTGFQEETQKFSYHTPGAHSVQLVGDFTNWAERPIPLRREPNGVWQTAVRLEPGTHHYRFLVDGQWRDDPANPQRTPNPFGGHDAIRRVN